MADTKTSALTALTGANSASGDLVPIVDISDPTQGAGGTMKSITRQELQTYNAGTLTTDVKVLDLSATWNNAGVTFTGIKANFTNSASAAGSLPIDIQIGGASQFAVGITSKLLVGIDAANKVTIRNSTNAQTFNVYNTYTDASNYERGFMRWASNVLEIGAEAAGTGTARTVALNFGGHGFAPVTLSCSGSALMEMKFNRPSTGGIGGFIQATNGSLSIFGGPLGNTNDSKIVLLGTSIVIDPNPAVAAAGTAYTYFGTQVSNLATKVLKADINTIRVRAGTPFVIEAGNAYDSGATNRDGGALYLRGGAKYNSGANGAIYIGDTTTGGLSFWNATPVAQQSGTGETTGFTAGAGTAVLDDSTFTGNVGSTAYRINDIVKALKNYGLLAA